MVLPMLILNVNTILIPTYNRVIIFSLLFLGDAIICFECNSHNDSRCAQEIPPDQFKKECSEHKEGNVYTICRKITQSIEFEVHGCKYG